MTHINSVEKANAVINSVDRLWDEGKTIDDFIFQGRQEGENIGLSKGRLEGENIGLNKGLQEGEQKGQITNLTNNILKMNIKGFSAQDISNILDEEIDFVNNVIANNKE